MKRSIGLWMAIGLLSLAGISLGQDPPYRTTEPQDRSAEQPPAYPDQPVVPQDPVLRPRSASPDGGSHGPRAGGIAPSNDGNQVPAVQPPPPFTLTLEEEAILDRVLLFWERSSATVRSFACEFTRLEYDEISGRKENDFLVAVDKGEIRFAAPDKAAMWVEKGPRPERYICNGKSIFEYNYRAKLITEYRLPPEMQGKAITEKGPLPFLFGAMRAGLKKRFFLRLVTPEGVEKGQIWLEACPRFLDDARNFSRAHVILKVNKEEILPTAIQLFQPNGKNRTVYMLSGMSVNAVGLVGALFGDPFSPRKPGPGWQIEVAQNEPAAAPLRKPPQSMFIPPPGPTGTQPRTRR